MDIKKLAVTHFAAVYVLIEQAAQKQDIDFFLLGANATSLHWLNANQPPPRATKDIDFAVWVNSDEQYEALITDLLNEGFIQLRAPFTLRHDRYDVVVDVMPFGPLSEEGRLRFTQLDAELVVIGFDAVHPNFIETLTDTATQMSYRVAPLAGIFLLKAIAFGDRPEVRVRDVLDMRMICEHIFDLQTNRIYDEYSQAITDDLDVNDPHFNLWVGGRVIGLQIAELLANAQPYVKKQYARLFTAPVQPKALDVLTADNKLSLKNARRLMSYWQLT